MLFPVVVLSVRTIAQMFTTDIRKMEIAIKSETFVITALMFLTVIKKTWTGTVLGMPVTLTRMEMVGWPSEITQ